MTDAVKPDDVREPIASHEVFVLDIRAEEDWEGGSERIPGSVHIPADEIESRLDELPDDRKILVVSPEGEQSAEVAEKIDGDGREAASLEGGVKAWKSDSYLTQPSPDADPPKGEDEPPHEEPGDEEPGENAVEGDVDAEEADR